MLGRLLCRIFGHNPSYRIVFMVVCGIPRKRERMECGGCGVIFRDIDDKDWKPRERAGA